MNRDELKEVLDKHRKWLSGEEGGKEANLRGADLSWDDLHGADLSGADLHSADLSWADLHGADLHSADLSGAEGSQLALAQVRILPEGTLIGWKKCNLSPADGGGVRRVLVKLEIPADARRSNAAGRKCRASKAKVLAIYNMDGSECSGVEACSIHDASFAYRVGETAEPREPFDEDPLAECASGIHFFITREEAEAYV